MTINQTRIDFATAMIREVFANKKVVLRENVLPSPVTHFDLPLRRLNNVREQYCREYAVTLGLNVAALAG